MQDKIFEVKEEHLKLIRKMYVSYNDYCEFGAPAIDPKRPYGNSWVYGDIADILGIEPEYDDYGDRSFSDEQERYMLQLHIETSTVIQIIFSTGIMAPGLYKSNWHGYKWYPVTI